MRLDNLDLYQLRQLGIWLDMAEHHAMSEYAHSTGDESMRQHHCEDKGVTGICCKNKWGQEINLLVKTQTEIRELVEKKAAPKSFEPAIAV